MTGVWRFMISSTLAGFPGLSSCTETGPPTVLDSGL